MKESLNLSLQQKMQQRLSPLQVRYGRMLEMNGPEIEDEVQRMLDDNPALDIVETPSAENGPDEFTETAEDMQLADYRVDDIPSYRLEAPDRSESERTYEPLAPDSGQSLLDTLSSQLAEHTLSDEQRSIALYVIGNLDDNGYLTRDAASMAYDIEAHTGLPVTTAQVQQMIALVRTMDPAGVGAVDLRECLLLQLRRKQQSPPVKLATEIVEHYFDIFSLKHYDRLASLLGVDQPTLREAMKVIRTLNPKPGGEIESNPADDRTRHIIPDFQIDTDGQTVTLTLLNNIPELTIEESFRDDDPTPIPRSRRDREATLFIRQKRDEAREFMRLVSMRQETLFNVMSAIVRLQRDFFVEGEQENLIRPMILKDIASITGYDLSVISRATAGKYVATGRGVYPLKLFFNERPTDDNDTSTHAIMAALKECIAHEDKSHPLSDEALAALLAERGYDIARRTVAKYRERLGYPVARMRRDI
ncbi:RNA polymerase factor sigma-54 [uncultured Muribaculum sp.]|uniref:RNA polymerase factor sigma-54 n=1 Tax=uncultured Muribaculum sp. TaxID=1918613 RepID=UPI0025E513F0|nr:RNA polymerase factor sigma-54 [uncultured Muribaculum sp.]